MPQSSTITPNSMGVETAQAPPAEHVPITANVNKTRIINADTEPGNWLTHGRTYSEQRFSPLNQINTDNVTNLKLAWYLDLDTDRGQEATPLIVDGVMYTTTAWSMVYAVDAASGEVLWRYDPEVAGQKAVDACCDVVNRGAAVWQGKVFVGALDGRLIALDARTGQLIWSVQTTPAEKRYTITGAPRVANGKVLIGNAGAEFDVRGYVSAYDAETGELAWRFYTVPGDPSLPFESAEMENAAKTWTGEWWKYGGGGTVWDAIVYDPVLDLVYIGVGNGAPWNQKIRSPNGGDNLFLTSIVALKAETGRYVWHYQTVPGETWDFTATQPIILAELEIEGIPRSVLMQAPKNGFFYVLDRATGELLSAQAFAPVNWASHVDLATGRPVEMPNARYVEEPAEIYPAAPGAHNWHPMAYSPLTKLVYIPTQEIPFLYKDEAEFALDPNAYSTGVDALIMAMPISPEVQKEILKTLKGYLLAWDPVKQQAAWKIPYPVAWNGGVVATAGNLVFQGTGHGEFVAHSADKGEQLWSAETQTGIVAGPVSYAVDGKQYIAVMAGWGGAFPIESGRPAQAAGVRNISRILAYSLDGKASLPALAPMSATAKPPAHKASAQVVANGERLYYKYCTRCHGDAAISGGVIPDLRHLDANTHAQWDGIVLGGALTNKGMVGFAELLSKEESDAIHAYVIKRAHDPDNERLKHF
ncbi:MAG: PQQ-dependent dehydrogenase, methanol/ethanol family [Pseudomonadota bacterium]